MSNINASRLFTASCFALITTAFAFGIRAGILSQLANDFQLTDTQLGYINQMAILGFPLATIVGGWLYNEFGAKRMMWIALGAHLLGILLTIFANGFETLLLSNLLIGFGNGTVEAACNPMIAAMFRSNQTTMLNRFHVWFPGGIFLGALISKFMTDAGMGWQAQIAVMLIPTAIYAYMFWGQSFPEKEAAGQASFSENLKGMANPIYLLLLFCMILTANTELSTQQWIERLLGNAGASPMLILAMVTGLMAVGRYFAGPVIHRLNPTGVLWGSSAIAFLGILMMSKVTGSMSYVAAVMFAVGVCYFWPTMIGATAEYVPKSGALGMSIMGGMGMFATGIAQPIVGGWIDKARAAANEAGLTAADADLYAGQHTLSNLAIFPVVLFVAFGVLWYLLRNRHH